MTAGQMIFYLIVAVCQPNNTTCTTQGISQEASNVLRLDRDGNLTYFYLKMKHLSILPETLQVVWYSYY